MEIQIKATNLNLTDSIKEYLHKRLNALDKLIDPEDTSVFCAVEVEKTNAHNKAPDMYRSEINPHIAGHDFRAEASEGRLFDAIDETKNQMSKELRRNKDKQIRNFRRGGAIIKNLLRGFGPK